jgi:hypothetical protein
MSYINFRFSQKSYSYCVKYCNPKFLKKHAGREIWWSGLWQAFLEFNHVYIFPQCYKNFAVCFPNISTASRLVIIYSVWLYYDLFCNTFPSIYIQINIPALCWYCFGAFCMVSVFSPKNVTLTTLCQIHFSSPLPLLDTPHGLLPRKSEATPMYLLI